MVAVSHPWQLFALRTVQGALSGTVSAATLIVAAMSPEEFEKASSAETHPESTGFFSRVRDFFGG